MPNIVGQAKLMAILNAYTPQTLPKTMLFIGPDGCGKHTITKYLADTFTLDLIELDTETTPEMLVNYLHRTINTLYLIDLNKISDKQQNQFLKFIEEPSKSVYVVLISNSEAGILNTVLNRCIKYTFEQYTKDELEHITNATVSEVALKVFKTPGKLLNLTDQSFSAIMALADRVVHHLHEASYGKALLVVNKINYKDLYNKIDFNLFFDAVEYLALEDYLTTNSKRSLDIFTITNKFKQHATRPNILKETLMLNYLTSLWEAVHQ